jgi:hypothetical protein
LLQTALSEIQAVQSFENKALFDTEVARARGGIAALRREADGLMGVPAQSGAFGRSIRRHPAT